MKRILIAAALLIPCHAEELTADELNEALAAKTEAFDEVFISGDGKTMEFTVNLGTTPVKVDDAVFDGFRFRCPELPEGADFVWYFNAPQNWGNWYIMPVEGKPGTAFRSWLDADKVYEPYDRETEPNRLRILQILDGGYFKSGKEYLMWFRKTAEGADNTLRGTAAFAKGKDSWDHDAIEKALSLKAAPPKEQVAALKSRGGKILLDPGFFEPEYAAGRIDSAFFSIRSTKRMSGGFFLTTQIAVPPCKTSPSFNEIVKKHGEPDFSRTGEEMARARRNSPDEEDEKTVTRHYYDYFAFEVETGAKEPKVLRVVTLGESFAGLRPPREGSSYTQVETENLMVFHKDGQEVGRAYHFLEGGDEPIFIKEPPPGEYTSGHDRLMAKGGGVWIWESCYEDGKVARKIPLKGNRFDGKAEGFYHTGKPQFTAEYRQGELNGEVVKFDDEGQETSRQKFKDGRPERGSKGEEN